jgi:hypothetical protein
MQPGLPCQIALGEEAVDPEPPEIPGERHYASIPAYASKMLIEHCWYAIKKLLIR